jgi:polysaccharide export outer membrane protein
MRGNIVTVTEVNKEPVREVKDKPSSLLTQSELVKLQEIKKNIVEKAVSSDIKNILEKTKTFRVAEYLAQYPNAKENNILDYKIGGYDILSITVYGEQDLSTESIRVSADGFISFPLIGQIRVADLTPSEIEKLIAQKLAEGQFVLNAHVSVMVTKYESRKVSVLGAVKNPGSYPIQARERVLDAISMAGGIDVGQEEKQEAKVIRALNYGKESESKIVIDIDLQGLLRGTDQISNIFLMDQDMLYIPKADYFYIIGQVSKPGSYAINKKDITIVEAISMAGGFTRIAATNKVRIVRIENGMEKIYDVDVDAITKAGKIHQAVAVKPNDFIVIPESFF